MWLPMKSWFCGFTFYVVFLVVSVWLPMKSWFCGFTFYVVLFFSCLCVVANEMRILWIAFGCSVVLVVFV